MEYSTKGKHSFADIYGIDPKILNSLGQLKTLIIAAAKKSHAKILSIHHHKFSPQGITIVGILSESSIDIHTYPESGYMAISIFTCGEKANPDLGIDYILSKLKHSYFWRENIVRGTL